MNNDLIVNVNMTKFGKIVIGFVCVWLVWMTISAIQSRISDKEMMEQITQLTENQLINQ